jgi:hypothetical protein
VSLLEKEISLVESVYRDQDDIFEGLRVILDSSSYRITDQMRLNSYEYIEIPEFHRLRAKEAAIDRHFTGSKNLLAKTAQVARYNIEINEEGHSKAILLFTLVTIVFLPLSFIATYLGMNTADMRNMESTQAQFWGIALPLTATIGVVALLVAYKGVWIRDRYHEVRKSFCGRRRSRKAPEAPRPQRYRKRDEEEVDDSESEFRPVL